MLLVSSLAVVRWCLLRRFCWCCAASCYAVLFGAVLCRVAVRCAWCCAALGWRVRVLLSGAVLCSVLLCCLCCLVLSRVVVFYGVVFGAVWCCGALCCLVWRCAVSCCAFCVVLSCSAPPPPPPAAALVVVLCPVCCRVVPCSAVCVVLCRAVLVCLRRFVRCSAALCCLWCLVLWCIVVCCAVSFGAVWCGGALGCLVRCCAVLLRAVLCCVMLYMCFGAPSLPAGMHNTTLSNELIIYPCVTRVRLVRVLSRVGDGGGGGGHVVVIVVGGVVLEVVVFARGLPQFPQGRSPKLTERRRGGERGREGRYMENKEIGEGTRCR